uniref:NADH dehydrogenase subunit 2 n=1 Tax=Thailocyba longilobula TaxID=3019674 RepID=UPI0030030649
MLMNSSKLLFYSTMLLGIFMSISSNNWIMIWCSLEISLMSIIPLMISKLMISSESAMKYFIVQSISSAMLMMAMLTMIMKGDYNYSYMLTTSLLIKTGVAPFHNWVLTVIEGLDLWLMLVTLTLNKIAPLTLISYSTKSMVIIILITMMAGSIMGINQNSLKKLIGYSSIFNMGLILTVIKSNLTWIYYLMIYSMMLMLITTVLMKTKMMFVNQTIFLGSMSNKISIWLNLLSMGGMPPLMGFSIKFMVMNQMINSKLFTLTSMMLMMSLLVMFFYLRITFMSIMNNSLMKKMTLFKITSTSWLTTLINSMSLPIILLMKPLY